MIAPDFLLGSGIIDITVGRLAEPVTPVDPRAEVVASSGGYPVAESPYLGPYGWHGRRVYERMLLAPPVGATIKTAKAKTLAGKCDLVNATEATTAAKLGQAATADPTAEEADMCRELTASNTRMLKLWDTPLDLVLWEMMDALAFGNQIAERVMDDVRGGPDDGLWTIRAIKPKHGLRFHVDLGMNVLGIGATTYDAEGKGEFKVLPPDHFTWLTHDAYCGDPRGRSGLRMAVPAWQRLEDLWPDCVEGWKDFGRPYLVGISAPNAQMVPIGDNKTITPNQDMATNLDRTRRNRNLGIANGADVKVVESTKDGQSVAQGIQTLEDQIIKSLILTTGAVNEAKHDSRAKGEVSDDVTATLIRFYRKWLERWLRSNLIYQNTLNYGPDIARRCTPLVDLGSTEHQDFATNAAGVGVLFQAGYFTEGQLPKVDAKLDLPVRTQGDPRVGPQGIMPDTPPADPNAPAAAPAPAQGVAA